MLKIITDSASDMPQYIVERFNLHVIPTPCCYRRGRLFRRCDHPHERIL